MACAETTTTTTVKLSDLATIVVLIWALAGLAWQHNRSAPQRQQPRPINALPIPLHQPIPDRTTLTAFPGP